MLHRSSSGGKKWGGTQGETRSNTCVMSVENQLVGLTKVLLLRRVLLLTVQLLPSKKKERTNPNLAGVLKPLYDFC